MFRKIRWFAPAAALAIGSALSGCLIAMDWEEVEGVPLAELDMSGAAPSEIVIAGPDSLIITEGESLSIVLEGNAEAADALRFDRASDKLTIKRDNSIFDGSAKAIIRMTMPPPTTLGVTGSGSIDATAMASSANLEIAGSGDLLIDKIESERLTVEIAGSGNVTAAGFVNTLDVEIAGSGNVRFAELKADTVTVEIAGSGDVDLSSDGTVDAEIAGSGNVRVSGTAKCSLDSAGSGPLTCKSAPAEDAVAK